MEANPGSIQMGNDVADQVVTVLLSTSMFVAGALGFILDNTIPGNKLQNDAQDLLYISVI